MPNSAFRRWTADEIAKLKNMAQKQPGCGDRRAVGSICCGHRPQGARAETLAKGASQLR
jgi:hypothetical protein